MRVPRDLQELAVKVDRVGDEMSRELGRAPTPAELAERTGTTLEQVLEAREASAAYRAVSLDRPRSEDDEEGDSFADAFGAVDPGFGLAEDAATVERLMRVLSDREREVLRLRFEEDLTQSEIGQRVGVSQMHVSRLIRQSISRLARRGRPPCPRRAAPVGRGGMEHWDLRTLDVPAASAADPALVPRRVAVDRDPPPRRGGAAGPRGARARAPDRRRRRDRGGGRRSEGGGRTGPRTSVFDPKERHEVRAVTDARLLLVLAPWPGEGHPGARD